MSHVEGNSPVKVERRYAAVFEDPEFPTSPGDEWNHLFKTHEDAISMLGVSPGHVEILALMPVGELLAIIAGTAHPCPRCDGSGKSGIIPLAVKMLPGHGPMSDEEAQRFADDIAKCDFCGASGKVPSVQLAWKAMGDEWLEARRVLGVGLREWAERCGVLPSEYCNMEHGRIAPRPECSPVRRLVAERRNSAMSRPIVTDSQCD